VVDITRDKKLVWEWHGEEHLQELKELLSPGAWRFFQSRVKGRFSFDWAHNNTCQVIPPSATYEKEKAAGGPIRFRPGNIIFSYRTLRGYSRVIEVNPLTQEIEWEYTSEPKKKLSSKYISGAQRLPNGNTLICEGAVAT